MQIRCVEDRLIVALDVANAEQALALVDLLMPLGIRFFKVGMSLFYQEGLGLVRMLKHRDCRVFVDLKLHDIPNTVGRTVDVLLRGGVDFLNVHASGGSGMMRAARQAADRVTTERPDIDPVLLGVTMLTSLNNTIAEQELNLSVSVEDHVVHLAMLSLKSGLQGVVCSPQEAPGVMACCGHQFYCVTPGIRLPERTTRGQDDQVRIATPALALKNGATHLVVGRPIYEADDPAEATRLVIDDMRLALPQENSCVASMG